MIRAVDDLRAARALVADPAHWTTGVFARDADGCVTYPGSETAVCWCALGALHRAGGNFDYLGTRYLRAAAGELFSIGPDLVNDDLGHAAVLRMYDRAIELAGAGS